MFVFPLRFEILHQLNDSLFTYLTATVTVNGLENEMSSELQFQGRKWGVESRVHPRDPAGVERGYPCLRPPIFDRENANFCEFHFFHLFFLTWLDKRQT